MGNWWRRRAERRRPRHQRCTNASLQTASFRIIWRAVTQQMRECYNDPDEATVGVAILLVRELVGLTVPILRMAAPSRFAGAMLRRRAEEAVGGRRGTKQGEAGASGPGHRADGRHGGMCAGHGLSAGNPGRVGKL